MSNTLWFLRVYADRALAEQAADILQEAFYPDAISVSLFEVKRDGHTNGVPQWKVEAVYDGEPSTRTLRLLLDPVLPNVALDVSQVPNIDWVQKSIAGLAPIRAGRFFVAGSYDAETCPPGAYPIIVDAGQAFGTGHHGTTKGCLIALDRVLQTRSPENALDLGCGSGVLALAIAKVSKRIVRASDIDPIAVTVTLENAKRNGVGPLVRAVTAPGFQHDTLKRHAPYDLIVANILARPLVRLATEMFTHMAPGGTLLLSGLMQTQEPWVRNAYAAAGFRYKRRLPLDEWATLEFVAPPVKTM